MNTSLQNISDAAKVQMICHGLRTIPYTETLASSAAALTTAILGIPLAFLSTNFNAVIIITIWKTSSLQTPSNTLIACLSLFNQTVGCVVQPLESGLSFLEVSGTHDCTGKLVLTLFSIFICGMSMVMLGLMSVDRYFAIHFPFLYENAISSERYIILVAIASVLFMSFNTLAIAGVIGQSLHATLLLIVAVLLIVVFVACNIAIDRTATAQRRRIFSTSIVNAATQITLSAENRKKARTIKILTWSFLICYSPAVLSAMIASITKDSENITYISAKIVTFLVFVSSTVTPLIYCFRAQAFRNRIPQLFKCYRSVLN